MSSRVIGVLVAAALASVSAAQTATDAKRSAASNSARVTQIWNELKYKPLAPIKFPDVEEITLSNGMRVMLLENHELPLVRGTAIIRTGNLFDPAEKVGLASITGETLRAGGTKDKTGDQLDVQLENVAASIESSIGEDSGTVGFSCLKENTSEVLALFVDVMAHPEFRQDKIDLAKQRMMSQISRQNDDAGEIAQREFPSILYGRDNSYGWDMTYATVSKIQRSDIKAFYERYFFPSNVILGVLGDFDSTAMKAELEKKFGSWTVKQEPVPPFPAVRFTYKPGSYLATKTDVNQTTFMMGQSGGERRSPDYAALEVMSDILGSGFNSRLVRRIRTQLGYVYDVDANWAAGWNHPGSFVINGSTKSSTTVQAIQAARKEVEKLKREKVSEEELEGAKQTVLNSFVFALDTPAKVINRLLLYAYFGYPKDFIFQYQKAVKALTREDIQRVAEKYLDPSKFITLAVGNPKDFGTPLDKLGLPVIPVDLTIPMPPGMMGGPGAGGQARE